MNEPDNRSPTPPPDPQSGDQFWLRAPPASNSEVDEAPFEEELAPKPETPAIDPWSRPARAHTPLQAAPAPPSPQALPRGWEWSRDAAPVFERPSGYEPFPDAAKPSPMPADSAPARPESAMGRLGLDLLALFMALVGGILGLVGAFFQELQSGVGILIVVIGAPVIEEALKPGGIYLLLVKWPQALRGRLHTALLCSISGAVFGVIESFIYVQVYYPEGNDNFVLFRFTVTPIMHAIASFIVGYGLTRAVLDWANGTSTLPKTTRNCFIAGMGLHAVYNTTVVVLGLLGVMDFLEN